MRDRYPSRTVLTLSRIAVGFVVTCSLVTPLRAADEAPPFDVKVARRITPEEVQKRRDAGEKAIILDTRGSTGDTVIRGSVHVTSDRMAAWAKDVPKDALIVAYCT